MPMPTPTADETRADFITRCMADPATKDIPGATAEEAQSRRVAACERIFDDAKKDAELEAKDFGLKAAAMPLATENDDQGAVSCVIATLGVVDNDGEIVAPDAIPDGAKAMISSYNHDTVMGSMLGTGIPDEAPVGKGVIRIEGDKAVFRGNYFMQTQRGKEAYLTAKAMGPDQRWSFAYKKLQVDKPTAEQAAKGARRVLAKLGPISGDAGMEVSPVNAPGGKGTQTLSIKSAAPKASVDGTEHPAEDFAYVPDPEKPSTWKLPIFDADHVRNALARLGEAEVPAAALPEVKKRIREAADRFKVDAASLDPAPKKSALDAQLETRIPRVKRLIERS